MELVFVPQQCLQLRRTHWDVANLNNEWQNMHGNEWQNMHGNEWQNMHGNEWQNMALMQR